jgi:DNA repair protein RecO
MHHIHRTTAFVSRVSAYRERDMIVTFLTEDFGMISAIATGVRKVDSKMRHSLVPFSFGEYEFVRGKDMWRLVSTYPVYSPSLQWYFLYERVSRIMQSFLEKDIPVNMFFGKLSKFITEMYDPVKEIILLYSLVSILGYSHSDEESLLVLAQTPELTEQSRIAGKTLLLHIERVLKEM